MKKIFSIIIILFVTVTMQSQVTLKPGIRGGVNFSRFTQNDNVNEVYKQKTDFYAGALLAVGFTKFYTLQPEINFSRQGANYEYIDSNNIKHTDKIDASYIGVGVINKFTFKGFNVLVGPSIDVLINNNNKKIDVYNSSYYSYNNDFFDTPIDFAFNAGLGYNITNNFGIEARFKKGIIPVNDWDETNILFQVGAIFTIDAK